MLYKIIHKIFLLARSLSIIFIALYLGQLTTKLIPIGVSDSIWGMLILFLALILGIVKLHWVYDSANLLVKYMTLLFIPFAVAIIENANIVWENIQSVLIANFISMLLTLIIVAFVTEYFVNLKRKKIHKGILDARANK